MFLVPYALPLYAAVITWNFMLQRDTGVINHLLVEQLGILDEAPFWLIGDNAFLSVVVVAIWRMWPFAFLISWPACSPSDGCTGQRDGRRDAAAQWRAVTLRAGP